MRTSRYLITGRVWLVKIFSILSCSLALAERNDIQPKNEIKNRGGSGSGVFVTVYTDGFGFGLSSVYVVFENRNPISANVGYGYVDEYKNRVPSKGSTPRTIAPRQIDQFSIVLNIGGEGSRAKADEIAKSFFSNLSDDQSEKSPDPTPKPPQPPSPPLPPKPPGPSPEAQRRIAEIETFVEEGTAIRQEIRKAKTRINAFSDPGVVGQNTPAILERERQALKRAEEKMKRWEAEYQARTGKKPSEGAEEVEVPPKSPVPVLDSLNKLKKSTSGKLDQGRDKYRSDIDGFGATGNTGLADVARQNQASRDAAAAQIAQQARQTVQNVQNAQDARRQQEQQTAAQIAWAKQARDLFRGIAEGKIGIGRVELPAGKNRQAAAQEAAKLDRIIADLESGKNSGSAASPSIPNFPVQPTAGSIAPVKPTARANSLASAAADGRKGQNPANAEKDVPLSAANKHKFNDKQMGQYLTLLNANKEKTIAALKARPDSEKFSEQIAELEKERAANRRELKKLKFPESIWNDPSDVTAESSDPMINYRDENGNHQRIRLSKAIEKKWLPESTKPSQLKQWDESKSGQK